MQHLRIPQPATLEEAKAIGVGAKVYVYWAGKLNKWFKATVSEVVPHTELSSDRPNDQVVPGVYYCVLKYRAQHGYDSDVSDIAWDEVFDWEDSVILELPEAGLLAHPDFQPPSQHELRCLPRPTRLSPQKKRDAEAVPDELIAQAEARCRAAEAARAARKRQSGGIGSGGETSTPRKRGRPANAAATEQPRDQQGAAPAATQQQQQERQARPGGASQPGAEATQRQQLSGRSQRKASQALRAHREPSRPAAPSQLRDPPGTLLGGGGDDDDDDFREAGPSQRMRVPRAPQTEPDFSRVPDPEGAPGAGLLKKVELHHFMCHAHLVTDFCPNVNLLTGINGSGKSAVLQALQCCLGARAAETGRYRSMREFVQRGEAQAVVKVTLWNTGPDAYRRSLLGPELSVVRRINANGGGGGFEVLDCRGRVALRGAREVQELVDELSIDASNPVIVLTQDTARSFAGERSEADKFKGFMLATHFQRTLDCLLLSNQHVGEMDAALAEMGEGLAALERRVEEKEQLLEQLREVKAWQAHQEQLMRVLAWAPVEALEKGIASLREALQETYPPKQAAHAAQVASAQRQLAALDAQLDEQQRRLAAAGEEAAGRQREAHEVKEAHRAQKRRAAALQRALAERQGELEELQQQRAALEEASREEDAELVRSTQAQVDGHRQRVAEARDAAERAGVAASGARQYRAEREAALAEAREGVRGAERELVERSQRVQRLEGELRRLLASQESPLSKFGGPATAELAAVVQEHVRRRRFRRPPILVGAQLSLADDRWAVAVEAAVGRSFNHWVVDNIADAQLLRGLVSELPSKPQGFSVVVMSFDLPLHAIPPAAELPEGVPTCMRVLRVAEGPHAAVVKNVLIDHAAIERTVLAHTPQEAKEHSRDAAFMQRYRVANVYAKDGYRTYRRGNTEYVVPPERQYRPRLVRDLSHQVAECRAELGQAQAAVAAAREVVAGKRAAVAQAERELQTAVQAHQASHQQHQSLQTQLREAESQRPLELGGEGAGGAAARRLAALANQVAECEGRVGAAGDELHRVVQEGERLAARLAELRAVPQRVARELAAVRDTITELAAEKEAARGQLQAAADVAEALAGQVALVQAKLAEAEGQFEGTLRDAEALCAREEAAEARAALAAHWAAQGHGEGEVAGLLEQRALVKHMEALERKIVKREADAQATYDELEVEVALLRQKLAKRRIQLRSADDMHSEVQAGWQMRRRKFKEMRSQVASNLSKSFQRYMGYRHHRGSIDVDYKAERLVFRVGINGAEPTSDMKSLSGGERSLASLTFILALGHVGVNPPFHALDEFDVFMDAVNRRLALAFLLEFAWRNPERQILLLTPQDVSVLDEAKAQVERVVGQQLPPGFIRLQRMHPPRRPGTQQAQA